MHAVSMNKKTVAIIIFLAVCLGTAFVQFNRPVSSPSHKAVISLITVKQIVGGSEKNEQVKRGSTALQLLTTTHKSIVKGKKENAYVTTIDGREAFSAKKEFWAFYINGKQATIGAGSYFVKNNDTIEWKIETY